MFFINSKQKLPILIILIIMILTLSVTGCQSKGTEEDLFVDEVVYSGVNPPSELSAWIVDWQWQQGMEDLNLIKNGLTSLQLFAAYFDEQDSLYFTDKLLRSMPEVIKVQKQNQAIQVYLTVVNDQFKKNGETEQMVSSLITRLMATPESRKKHMNELLAAADHFGVNGIEIDYEHVEEQDWERLLLFYSELYTRLQKNGKSLRIVLEPSANIEELKFPEGPDYVMMAYHLHGPSSAPGPQAEQAYIEKLANRMSVLPGTPYMAFSVGGFDWREDGVVTPLSEERADQLLKETSSVSQRDQASESLFFEYIDKDKLKHTVWYADEKTLSKWLDVAKQAGYSKAAIWSLGEIQLSTLDYLNLHTQ